MPNPFLPNSTTPAQIESIAKALAAALDEGPVANYAGVTRIVNEADLERRIGTNQLHNALGMFTRISRACGLGCITALVRRNDGSIGPGFWRYIHELGEGMIESPYRAAWLEAETAKLRANREYLIPLLDYIVQQARR